MKIGLVTPYIYPLPGGVNDHVRHLLFRENADSVEIHKLDPVVTYAPANNPSDEHQLGGQTYDHNNRE